MKKIITCILRINIPILLVYSLQAMELVPDEHAIKLSGLQKILANQGLQIGANGKTGIFQENLKDAKQVIMEIDPTAGSFHLALHVKPDPLDCSYMVSRIVATKNDSSGASLDSNTYYIEDVYTPEKWRRQGYATALLQYLWPKLKMADYKEVRLKSKQYCVQLYKNEGFKEIPSVHANFSLPVTPGFKNRSLEKMSFYLVLMSKDLS